MAIPIINDTSEYQYRPLPLSNHDTIPEGSNPTIRLLLLQPSTNDSAELLCDLKHVRLEEDPSYTPFDGRRFSALSYTWGEAVFPKRLTCQGAYIKITTNLELALRELRLPDDVRVLWVDAVCIDQRNMHERTSQLKLMSQIYGQAEEVHVWLGPDSPNQEGRLCFNLFEEIMTIDKEWRGYLGRMTLENPTEYASVRIKPIISEFVSKYTSKPLDCFFQRPYFTRRWIIQEIVMARSYLIVHCGKLVASWESIEYAADWLYSLNGIEVRVGERSMLAMKSILEMGKYLPSLRRSWTKKSFPTPLDLLVGCIHFDCEDDRDRVFSLLGVLKYKYSKKYDQKWNHTPHFRNIGYESPVEEVYTAFAKALLEYETPHGKVSDRCAQCVIFASALREPFHKHDSVLMPSWVADWRCELRYQPLEHWGLFHIRDENASLGLTRGMFEVDTSTNSLMVQGIPFDIVQETMHPVQSMKELRAALPLLLSMYHRCMSGTRVAHSQYGHTDKDFLRILGRSLIANSDRESRSRNIEYSDVEFLETYLLDDEPRQQDPEISEKMTFYSTLLTRIMRGRCFYTTEKGYVGIAPDDTHTGDIICIISRARKPWILRSKNGFGYLSTNGYVQFADNSMFQLIGDSYVHGIMAGEAVKQLTSQLSHAYRNLSIV